MEKTPRTVRRVSLVMVIAFLAAALAGCQTASKETLFQLGGVKLEREVKSPGLKGLITGNPKQDTRSTLTVGRRRIEVRDEGPSFGDILFGGGRK